MPSAAHESSFPRNQVREKTKMKRLLLFWLLSAASFAQLLSAQQAPASQKVDPNEPQPRAEKDATADSWQTPSEKSDYRTTPRYDETMAYVKRVAAAAPRQVKLET